jgi:hypothetical protein
MEPMTARARRTGMTKQRRIRGLATAALLCAALAGCGAAAAATASPQGAGDQPAKAMAPQVGCAGINQAASVTVQRHLINQSSRTFTQRKATLVRALFGDFCAALSHPEIRQPMHACPADFGLSYTGTFYDGHRVVATFAYDPAGCPRVSITAAGRTRATLLLGTAAAAAPHLRADLAAVLGVPESQVS